MLKERLLAGSATCLSVLAMVSAAQAADQPAPKAQAEATTVETVVVTAEKRAENVQVAPLAVSALSGNALKRSGIQDASDLQFAVPNMTVGHLVGGQGAQVTIRGIGSDTLGGIGGEGAVAVYIDGVYVEEPTYLTSSFFDVDHVEVLRGPQGTLYGRNATGGALNIISKGPTDHFTTSADLTLGNYDRVDADLAISGPIVPGKLLGRLAASEDYHSGYLTNLAPNAPERTADEGRNWSLRGELKWLVSDDLTVDFRGHHFDDEGRPSPLLLLAPYPTAPTFLGLHGGLPVIDNYYTFFGAGSNPTLHDVRTYSANTPVRGSTLSDGGSVEVDYRAPFARFVSISSIESSRYLHNFDLDGSDVVTESFSNFRNQYLTYSQELRLLSPSDKDRLQWVLGLYYYHENAKLNLDSLDASWPALTGEAPAPFNIDGAEVADSYAAYGQATFHLNDQWSVVGGVRYTYDRKSANESFYAPTFGLTVPLTDSREASWGSTTWKAGLTYKPTEHNLAYFTVSTGFKAGGINVGGFQPPFKPESVISYEVGSKNQFANNRVLLNLAAFYYSYDNLQVSQILNFRPVVDNAARAHAEGVELEFAAIPIDGLQLNLTASYLDARFDNFLTQDQAIPGPVIQLKGNVLERAPAWKVSPGAQYTWQLGNGDTLTARVDYAWTSRQYFLPTNRPAESQGDYGLTSLRATWRPASSHWRVELWAKNLENRNVFANIGLSGANFGTLPEGVLLPPRTFGATVRFDY